MSIHPHDPGDLASLTPAPRRGREMDRRLFIVGAAGSGLCLAAGSVAPLSIAERRLVAATLGADGRTAPDLLEALMTYARREAGQRLRPSSIDRAWTLEAARRDLGRELAAARQDGRLAEWIAGLSPRAPDYAALQGLKTRYASFAQAGDWSAWDGPARLLPDARDPQVARLRARLSAEGYSAPAAEPELFDRGLADALRVFQANHGLTVDGVPGPATRRELNVAPAARLAAIEANLERARWSPRLRAPDRVEVDTGLQVARLIVGGQEHLRMPVVVGAPAHPTPMFAAQIEAVVANPFWNVPDSIARNELLPAERRRPGHLAAMGIGWVNGRLRQRPGPQNALGLTKLEVRSPFDVHLHDTPAKALFSKPVRAFSHGCIRLEQAEAMATALLGTLNMPLDPYRQALHTGATTRWPLVRPLPLIVTHTTVATDDYGRALFRPDIYGWDRKLTLALAQSARQG
ncbi:L,D-transpeptidase family protein [Phenylobacterium immobile]|uniref:L,D-transpeptidase family protein n=1 Tax=Phenylobacterium immobile TaxID=21 RepID=UPI000A9D1F45|nr:L,D-transpeptidase family protein [Phenylobacterium immobile]